MKACQPPQELVREIEIPYELGIIQRCKGLSRSSPAMRCV